MMSQTPVEELDEKLKEVRFGIGICSLSIIRYLTDYVPQLPIGIVSRMLQTNDTLMAILPLADNPPWVRKRKDRHEQYENNTWKAVPPSERFRVCSPSAQVRKSTMKKEERIACRIHQCRQREQNAHSTSYQQKVNI